MRRLLAAALGAIVKAIGFMLGVFAVLAYIAESTAIISSIALCMWLGLWYLGRRIEREFGGAGESSVASVHLTPEGDEDDTDGDELEVVGESHYQRALASIVGGKARFGVSFPCTALLVPEPENPHDVNAVRVEIQGKKVGYIAREGTSAARRLINRRGDGRSLAVNAEIVGGWDDGTSTGHFGVQLRLDEV